MSHSLRGKTVFITGASRGIGRAIALRCAKDGANIAIVSKTTEPHPKLPGTIFTVAKEVEDAGGRALPLECDVRSEEQVRKAVEATVAKFGGIDILVNNASAIWFRPTLDVPMKKYDLMHQVNGRGTFLCSQACLPYLKKSAEQGRNPHILMLSPPLDMRPKWFAPAVAYAMSKYNMSMVALGLSEEVRSDGIAVNALWPRTAIATAAIEFISGPESLDGCRTVDIMSDAAHVIFTSDAKKCTGNFFIDDTLLRTRGVTDFSKYTVNPGKPLIIDFFVEAEDLGGDANTLRPKL
jgi:citronellol/citronellal dehydrogenase